MIKACSFTTVETTPERPAADGVWILLIEACPRHLEVAAGELKREGFTVRTASTAKEGIALAGEPGCAAVLVDLQLPDGDGWSVLEALSSRGTGVPVVFWAERASVATRVRALESGAQEFVPKDIAWEELAARLRARIRRAAAAALLSASIKVADLEIDPLAMRAVRAGRVLRLAPREFQLLVTLARRPGTVVTDEELERHVWGMNESVLSNAVPVAFSRLKKKVDTAGCAALLRRVRGQGYMLTPGEG